MVQATVIVPTYRRPRETVRCLENVLDSQHLGSGFSLKAVVVDSSPDQQTRRALDKLRPHLELDYLHLPKRTTPGDARNLAVSRATTELIVSVDSDIELEPPAIWGLICCLRDHPRLARITGTTLFSSGRHKGEIDRPRPFDRLYQEDGTTFLEGIYGRYEAFYRSCLLKVKGYDPLFQFFAEGTDLSIKFWRAGLPLGYAGQVVALHDADAPSSLCRDHPDRKLNRYQAYVLIAFKYGLNDPEACPHFADFCQHMASAYESRSEIYPIISGARSAKWFRDNYSAMLRSRRSIPRTFDFKPLDVFSRPELLAKCLGQAEGRIKRYYQAVFG